jgi:diguanylate cyclase (GGDEF)-like protein
VERTGRGEEPETGGAARRTPAHASPRAASTVPHDPRARDVGSELTRSFLATVVLVGVVLASTVVVYAVLLLRVQPRMDALSHARDHLQAIEEGLLVQDAAVTAYLSSGDVVLLSRVSAGAEEVEGARTEIAVALAEESSLADDHEALEAAEQEWRTTWVLPTVASAPTAPSPSAVTAGRVLFDRYQAAQDALVERIDDRLADLSAEEDRMLWWGAGTALVACVALLATVRAQRRLGAESRAAHVSLERERFLSDAQADMLASKTAQLAAILAMNAEVSGALEVRYVTDSVRTAARTISGFDEVEVVLWLDQLDLSRPRPRVSEDDLVNLVLGTRRSAFRAATPSGTRLARSLPGPVVEVALPMKVRAVVVGVLVFRHPEPIVLAADLLEVLEAIASQAAAAVDAAVLHESLEHAAGVDALTGLLNRRRLEDDMQAATTDLASSTAVLMVDLDHFKVINDSRGHQRGDDVLRHVAGLLADNLRDGDSAYRYGGEEFLVLMPNTEVDDAVKVVTRLAAAVRATFPNLVEGRPLTVSAGISLLGERPLAVAIGEADDALYRAKQEGRDRIVLAA